MFLAAVHKAIDQGQIYAGQHELEVEVATMLVEQIDCAEKVRFALSGTDVTQLAVRLAKAYTGRSKILKFEGPLSRLGGQRVHQRLAAAQPVGRSGQSQAGPDVEGPVSFPGG